jgi:hypothetical protein
MSGLNARRARVFGGLVALLAGLGVLAGGAAAQTPTAQTPTALQVSTQPSLFPTFDESVRDYVVRCQPTNEVEVSVSTPPGVAASVDGRPWRNGGFTQTVSLTAGQSFEISTSAGETYVIRCLPSDFPTFTATRNGPTQAEWYVVTPNFGTPVEGVSRQYVAFFDNNGVPVWWMPSAGSSIAVDAKLLPNGNVVWMHVLQPGPSGAEEHQLDGSLVRTLDTVPGGADFHDIQLLPNGNYLLGKYTVRTGDLSSCGGPETGAFADAELQELSPNGDLVWSWRASDHIPFTELTATWQDQCSTGDIYHWNSVERDGDGYVLSFRHLDAVYRIDRATGAIDWKLGGDPRPESLTVVDDPLSAVSTFCGQHDPRVLSDESLTVHDNGSRCDRAPRAVRYAIDETANTATLLEDVRDPEAPSSFCCGSSRRLPGGNWVSAWGGNPYVTEQTGAGVPVFKLSFTQGLFTYRAHTVSPGQVSRVALRAGMDAQYPRPRPPTSPYTTSTPSHKISLGKPKLNKKNGTAIEPVAVPGPGVLTLGGTGVVRQGSGRASASRIVNGAGIVNMLVKPKGKAKRKLNTSGRARVKITITFTPTGGTANSESMKIKLRKR